GGAQAIAQMGAPIRYVEVYDPMGSTWTLAGDLSRARAYHTVTLASDGALYIVGGYDGSAYQSNMEKTSYNGTPDLYTSGGYPNIRQASMTAVDAELFDRSGWLTAKGFNFQGVTEAAGGGAGSADSDHTHPRLVLQAVAGSGGGASQGDSGYLLDLTTKIYQNSAANLWMKTDSSVTVQLPPGVELPYGWYHVRAGANDQLSKSRLAHAGPPLPSSPVADATGTVLGISSINFTWSAPGAGSWDGYNIYSSSTSMWLAFTTDTKLTLTGLKPSTTQHILIAPFTLSGDGPLTGPPTFYTRPDQPLDLAVSSATSAELVLSWNAHDNGAGTIYEITQSTDDFATDVSTPYPMLARLTTTHALIALLNPNYEYYFRVRAFNLASVASDYSDTVSTQTRVIASVPTPIVHSSSWLQWTWPASAGALRYYVYNATSGLRHAEVNTPTWNDTDLLPNSIHSVMISVVNAAGEGPLSASATAYTHAEIPGKGGPGVWSSSVSISASWDQGRNPVGTAYQLRITSRSATGALGTSSATVVSEVLGVPMTATISELPPSELYKIDVRAFNNDPEGAPDKPTDWFSLSPSSVATFPDDPKDMAVVQSGPDYLTVAWDNGRDSSSSTYEVTYTSEDVVTHPEYWETRTSTSLYFADAKSLGIWTITGLLTSVNYHVRVRASNPLGQLTGYTASTNSFTNAGGAPLGSIAGILSADRTSVVSGTVDNPNDARRVLLRSPGGAFPSDTTVTISTYSPGAGLCGGSTARAYSVSVSPAMQPVVPLFFTVYYADVDVAGKDLARLAMMRYDPASNKCVPLATTVDRTNKTVTAQLNHLSVFQIDEWRPAATPAAARVYPNPFYAAHDGFVTFDTIPASARLRIFTLRGEMLLDQRANASGIVVWPGTNRGGRPVASGVYLAVIEGGGQKKILKVAVIR
ncbi:MAG: fibronectin type III domain-containing protein, partial [Elusimicrobia bacterium]|nr:fibronectin type III domain-containing protein [Elusimicrobiota bacterium]